MTSRKSLRVPRVAECERNLRFLSFLIGRTMHMHATLWRPLVCPANKNKKENFSSFPFLSFLYQPGHYFLVFLCSWPGWRKEKRKCCCTSFCGRCGGGQRPVLRTHMLVQQALRAYPLLWSMTGRQIQRQREHRPVMHDHEVDSYALWTMPHKRKRKS